MSQSDPVGRASRAVRGAAEALRGLGVRHRAAAILAVLLVVAVIVVAAGRDGEDPR
ncbi:hypothetical protein [Thermomonospora amylolytica]|uniref:hypothetical protein n=1 Tax=Thermomonospora amylolytica TaxID=1411117 RepID=UPI001300BD08|nr:hypothetical protein [Thermomonospora amylolytica]